VKHGETGLVVPPEDPEALALAILRFFEDGLGQRLGAGIEALRHAHSWQALARETVELVDELAPARGWR
jgi:glycosyltransferase involved in cell wall biosynthesis